MTASIEAPPTSILTHVALHVRDLDGTLAFYRRFTHLELIHERRDEVTGLRSVWLANAADRTEAAARFVVVLIEGKLPAAIVGDMEEHYGFLTDICHLGMSMDSREAVDRVAEMARADGCLVLGPRYMNPVVGYIAIVADPDGNQLEFSVEQVLGYARAMERVDTVVTGAVVVTMNGDREVLRDGAVAIAGAHIVAVGPSAEVLTGREATEVIDGRNFVVTPGMVNTHIHITGEPLTRGFVPDDTAFEENVFGWLCPLYAAHNEEEERLSAQLAAAEMLRSGTTTFLEAGTIHYLDAVVDGLSQTGIRGRVGRWVWDLPPEPAVYRQTTAEAIANLESELGTHGGSTSQRLAAWPMIVGHTTCSDDLWRHAKALSDEYGTGLNFHMSPAAMDPEGFLATFGERPMVHLAKLGVLDHNVVLAHCVHVDDEELALLAKHRCNVAHCPTTALKVAYGVTQIGKMPEMAAAGVNVCIGTDGCNASNYSDLMRATYLVAGLFKDTRRDPTMFPAETAYEMATLGGARALGLAEEIGSIEVGKRADLVLHDRRRPEWTPLHNVANQLVYAADGRGVHTVFVDGRKVVDDYALTTLDEGALFEACQRAGEAVTKRSGLVTRTKWAMR